MIPILLSALGGLMLGLYWGVLLGAKAMMLRSLEVLNQLEKDLSRISKG